MKKFKTLLSLVIVAMLVISSPLASFAGNGNKNKAKENVKQEKAIKEKENNKNKNKNKNNGSKKDIDETKLGDMKADEIDNEKFKNGDEDTNENEIEPEESQVEGVEDKGKNKDWKIDREKIKNEKKELNQKRKQLDAEKKDLEKQYKEAKDSGNAELAEELKSQVEDLEMERARLKEERKELQFKFKEITRNKYTLEELEKLEEIGEDLEEEDGEIEVIPVENIIIEDEDIKFDAPPIKKGGRTLVPVRTISEGLGATVEWVAEDQKVTIIKEDVEIVLHIDRNVAIVNGQEVEIDAPSTLYGGRTYVPLRFIAEAFGLEVNYDEETGMIEIEKVEENINQEETEK